MVVLEREAMAMASGPFVGIRVPAFCQIVAGPVIGPRPAVQRPPLEPILQLRRDQSGTSGEHVVEVHRKRAVWLACGNPLWHAPTVSTSLGPAAISTAIWLRSGGDKRVRG